MKKLYTLIFLMIALMILGIWILEPFSLNPFKNIQIPKTESTVLEYKSRLPIGFKSKAEELMNRAISSNDFLGVSAGIYSFEKGEWTGAAGFSSKRDLLRMNTYTKSRTASLSKPMTAIGIMRLAQDSLLDLDQPIQTYLENFPKKDQGDISIRQLLNHTSGLPHWSSQRESIKFSHFPSLIDALELFENIDLKSTPGTEYRYSSYGYILLGAIIEKVSGQSFQDYLNQNVWDVANMENTSVEEYGKKYDNKARLYIKYKSHYLRSLYDNSSFKYSAGGVQSTAQDLLNFGKALINYEIIDSSFIVQMISDSQDHEEYGNYRLGWHVESDINHGRVIYHGGAHLGSSAYLRIYMDAKVVVCVLANNTFSGYETRFLAKDLSSILFDSTLIQLPLEKFEKDTSMLKKWL